MRMTSTDGVAFELVDFEGRGTTRAPLHAMLEGELLGILVRGVFPEVAMAEAVRRLSAGESDIEPQATAYYRGRSFGRLLTSESDLPAYFAGAARTADAVSRLFSGTGAEGFLPRDDVGTFA